MPSCAVEFLAEAFGDLRGAKVAVLGAACRRGLRRILDQRVWHGVSVWVIGSPS